MGNIIVNYTKAQYEAKITELEGYHQRLSVHLENMKRLKDRIPEFWDDNNAKETGKILTREILYVNNAMERTNDMLIVYRSAVREMDGLNLSVGSLLEDALSILGTFSE